MNVSRGPLPPRTAARFYKLRALRGLKVGEKLLLRSRPLDSGQLGLYSGHRHTDLINHVTFGMPALVAHGSVDFYELLQNRIIAAWTFGGKACRVVITTIYIIVVLIIWILWPEERRADRAREMLNMIFFVYREVRVVRIIDNKVWGIPHATM